MINFLLEFLHLAVISSLLGLPEQEQELSTVLLIFSRLEPAKQFAAKLLTLLILWRISCPSQQEVSDMLSGHTFW
jgi:hypothetical protein